MMTDSGEHKAVSFICKDYTKQPIPEGTRPKTTASGSSYADAPG